MNKKLLLLIEIAVFIIALVIIAFSYNKIISKNIENNSKELEENNVETLEIENEGNNMEILEIENKEQYQKEVLDYSDGTVFVDFYATWCMPCQAMSPIIEEIASEYENVKFVKVDVDKNEEVAMEYGIMSIPTMFIVKNGEITKTFVGMTSKSEIVKEL